MVARFQQLSLVAFIALVLITSICGRSGYAEKKRIEGLDALREKGVRIADDAPLPPDLSESDELLCGAQSAYVMMKLLKVNVNFNRLMQQFDVDPERGVSVDQIVRVLNNRGLDTAAYRASPSELSSGPVPVIALLRTDRPHANHFVTITRCDDDQVQYVDGTTFANVTVPVSQFSDRYAGVVVRSSRDPLSSAGFYSLVFCLSGWAACAGLWIKRRMGAVV